MKSIIAVLALAAIVPSSAAVAETICVKYGPCPIDLSSFKCADTSRSSFVRNVCYDARNRFMVMKLNETWYPYCDVDAKTVDALVSAPSIGSFYNANIRSKRDGTRGPFDCRDHKIPTEYKR